MARDLLTGIKTTNKRGRTLNNKGCGCVISIPTAVALCSYISSSNGSQNTQQPQNRFDPHQAFSTTGSTVRTQRQRRLDFTPITSCGVVCLEGRCSYLSKRLGATYSKKSVVFRLCDLSRATGKDSERDMIYILYLYLYFLRDP